MAETKSVPSISSHSGDSVQGSTNEPLYQVKLLSALRSGDPAQIHPFLAEINKDRRSSIDGDIDTGAAALHLAVRCGTAATVQFLLSQRAISPNGVHPPGSGTTPLHLAASLGRVDIVNLLLEQENIDDSLRDRNGKTCKDIARGKEVIRTIDDSRSFLNASYRSLFHSYIHSPPTDPPPAALTALLESPRVKFVDLSYLDNDTGNPILHEAAKRKDLRLIELLVRAGADIFVRNRRGKMAYDGTGKDDRVRVFLRQIANHDKTLIPNPSPLNEPPVLRGYLNKYTNVAKGYNTRWFVLKNGVLSYYRHQDDETVASRGSISMKSAILRIMEKNRFEVHSSSHGGGAQKWYMKANHPVEAHRWTEAISRSIEWWGMQQVHNVGTESDASSMSNIHHGTMARRRRSGESDSSAIKSIPSMTGGSHSLSNSIWRRSTQHGPSASGSGRSDQDSVLGGSSIVDIGSSLTGLGIAENGVAPKPGPGIDVTYRGAENGDDEADDEDTSSADSDGKGPPHPTSELTANAAAAQLELTSQLLTNLISSSQDPTSSPKKVADTHEALKESLGITQNFLSSFITMSQEREKWYDRQLKKERKSQKFWEESLAVVVREGEDLEKELRMRSRRRGSRVFGPSSSSNADRRASLAGITTATPTVLEEEPFSPPADGSPPPSAISPRGDPAPFVQHITHALPAVIAAPVPSSSRPPPSRSGTVDTIISPHAATASEHTKLSSGTTYVTAPDDEVDTDDEDEFFDAIESGNLPNLVVREGLTSPTVNSQFLPSITEKDDGASEHTLQTIEAQLSSKLHHKITLEPYAGYVKLRQKLALKDDERPSTSLWSVLKHSIGKDLTKISFPVFFNEPTSMLQRMAEDMEFSECLDVAANEPDPLRRIAYVAAFAMSNYSSTIGRIAKPFNPMLSETFEYVRLDRQYRYVSEQVSHHPPISACWAESPSWHYYGEVDAQNKFMGKSFEIRPTGVAHADLLLPEDWAPKYPRAQGETGKGKVVEHYSWKKVTTNVSGFILGSPTIDHYGDMVVTNHRTGDQCILTFKPRGWRGKDAYEISGEVVDHNGHVAYDIAGRWNSQLVAKRAGGRGSLHPDMTVSGPNSPSVSPEYILLWRNSEKIPGSPFNLTPFALTLNDCPQKTLKPFLCPTDCRLRPDQRAFELGKYELANGLKQAQEEKQRAIRKAREEGKMERHRPRWFSAETEGDTGERVWTPVRDGEGRLEYWVERERVWREGGGVEWKGVDDIFIEEPQEVSVMIEKLEEIRDEEMHA
ncbi:Oxysterol-binding protein-domain-containing protein [Panaeolus papilionaceus]|nr:Oxysterol-binding protein-domain-containing protein [Panaeolus papilionaceus]